jgi:hypothetical protein
MKWSHVIGAGSLAAALACVTAPQAGAIEVVQGASPVARLSDGMITEAYVARRGAVAHGGVYRGPRGGVYRGGTVYRGGAVHGYPGYRGGYAGYHGGAWGAWARPGWYAWPVGGAIAAGAAIGMVSAATAASWAGAAPGPGLCWYYTDPSRRQGFWDACQ